MTPNDAERPRLLTANVVVQGLRPCERARPEYTVWRSTLDAPVLRQGRFTLYLQIGER